MKLKAGLKANSQSTKAYGHLQNLGTTGQMTCFVDFLSENKFTHPLQRTQFCTFLYTITVYLLNLTYWK